MKRSGTFIILLFLISLAAAYIAGAAATPIKGSKHDLSYRTTNTVPIMSDSGGTTEICVFCHTPHHSRTDAPLWNRTNVSGPYTPYGSDVMTALSYTAGDSSLGSGLLHVKTRICLSCHDGTIALGRLVNSPLGMGVDIPMVGAGNPLDPNAMPYTAQGYIGTDLRDDHPVAIKYFGNSPDPELNNTIGSLTYGGNVIYLYNSSAGRTQATDGSGYIECTTCHNAHDNQYGNFLVGSNWQSEICRACHDKAGYYSLLAGESIHSNTTYATSYSPPTGGTPGTLGASVQSVKCMDCHFPHKAGVTTAAPTTPNPPSGKYLLSFQEEASCFNSSDRFGQTGVTACHGTGSVKNIQGELSKNNRHRVDFYANAHSPAKEGRDNSTTFGWLNVAGNSWHVECDDCHNSHSAGNTLHTKGTNTISTTSTLYGAGGVRMTWPTQWQTPGQANYNWIEPLGLLRTSGPDLGAQYEYQVCLRCHSSFAWGVGSLPSATLSDQAKEFNVNNVNVSGVGSYHSVVQLNSSRYNATAWTAGSGFSQNSLMNCSDCHKNNSASPAGPHASTYSSILFAPANGSSYGTYLGYTQLSTDLCLQCHDPVTYLTAVGGQLTSATGFRLTGAGNTLNLHTQHAWRSAGNTGVSNVRSYVCVNCHIRNAHGWKRRGLVVFNGDGVGEPYPAAYEAQGVNTGLINAGSSIPAAPASYGTGTNSNCTTAPGCHQ